MLFKQDGFLLLIWSKTLIRDQRNQVVLHTSTLSHKWCLRARHYEVQVGTLTNFLSRLLLWNLLPNVQIFKPLKTQYSCNWTVLHILATKTLYAFASNLTFDRLKLRLHNKQYRDPLLILRAKSLILAFSFSMTLKLFLAFTTEISLCFKFYVSHLGKDNQWYFSFDLVQVILKHC